MCTVNHLTIKEIGIHLTSLTDLNLNAGPLKGLGVEAEEELIKTAANLKQLKTLRVPPFSGALPPAARHAPCMPSQSKAAYSFAP